MRKDNPIINTIGKRILVIGNSCSGKSTLAGFLASVLDVPFIELDSLNWEENWVSLAEKDPEELTRRFQKATSGDCWVVAGSYTEYFKKIFWEKLETIIKKNDKLAKQINPNVSDSIDLVMNGMSDDIDEFMNEIPDMGQDFEKADELLNLVRDNEQGMRDDDDDVILK